MSCVADTHLTFGKRLLGTLQAASPELRVNSMEPTRLGRTVCSSVA
jgi:hypothetical protein